MGKLVLSRRVGERVAIDETTFVSVERVRGDYVRLGFEAPRHVRIVRDELDRTDDAKPANVTAIEWESGPPEAINDTEFLIDNNGFLFIAVRHDTGIWTRGGDRVSELVQSASRHVLLSDVSWHRPDEMDRADGTKPMARGSVNLSHMTRSQHADIARLAGLLENWVHSRGSVPERERDVAKLLFDALNLDVDDYV